MSSAFKPQPCVAGLPPVAMVREARCRQEADPQRYCFGLIWRCAGHAFDNRRYPVSSLLLTPPHYGFQGSCLISTTSCWSATRMRRMDMTCCLWTRSSAGRTRRAFRTAATQTGALAMCHSAHMTWPDRAVAYCRKSSLCVSLIALTPKKRCYPFFPRW
jgi:hypothetical protein